MSDAAAVDAMDKMMCAMMVGLAYAYQVDQVRGDITSLRSVIEKVDSRAEKADNDVREFKRELEEVTQEQANQPARTTSADTSSQSESARGAAPAAGRREPRAVHTRRWPPLWQQC